MEMLSQLVDIFLHLDEHLTELAQQYGPWIYLILFLVIFAETGLVVTPFLPGDSLLFAAGALAGIGALRLEWLLVLLAIAAILGDTVNYWIGNKIGHRAFDGSIPFLKQSHLKKTHDFYERHGNKTIVLARFVPIVRTFAPFVAGVGSMHYGRFLVYNVVGGVVWVWAFVWAGYLFGNLPFVQENFSWVILAIIILSVAVIGIDWVKDRFSRSSSATTSEI